MSSSYATPIHNTRVINKGRPKQTVSVGEGTINAMNDKGGLKDIGLYLGGGYHALVTFRIRLE